MQHLAGTLSGPHRVYGVGAGCGRREPGLYRKDRSLHFQACRRVLIGRRPGSEGLQPQLLHQRKDVVVRPPESVNPNLHAPAHALQGWCFGTKCQDLFFRSVTPPREYLSRCSFRNFFPVLTIRKCSPKPDQGRFASPATHVEGFVIVRCDSQEGVHGNGRWGLSPALLGRPACHKATGLRAGFQQFHSVTLLHQLPGASQSRPTAPPFSSASERGTSACVS